MQFDSIAILLLFCFPFFSSCLNGINMTLSLRNKINPEIDRIRRILILFYVCTGVIWLAILLLQFNNEATMYINSFYYSFSLLWVLLFYHYIFYMTSTDTEERFPNIYYIIPAGFFLFLMIYPHFRALNISFFSVNDEIVLDPTFRESSLSLFLLAIFRRLFMVFFGILCFLRLRRFRLVAKEEWEANKWLGKTFALYGVIVLVTFLRLFDYDRLFSLMMFTIVMAVSLVILQSMICFNMLCDNYKLVNRNTSDPATRKYSNFQKVRFKSYDHKKRRIRVEIDRSEFENYFRLKKPYLNSELKIDDMVKVFSACRSIISSFVNGTYGMSFSLYVNRWRLHEMERLMKMKSNIGKDPKELIPKAGFGSYRNYIRVKSHFNNDNESDL